MLDHHEPGPHLPPADACIDPKRADCPYPFKHMSAGGLAWLFAQALYARAGVDCPREDELLGLAALTTITDVMELREENRLLVKEGLKALGRCGNPGIQALLRAEHCDGKPCTVRIAGFVLGPCINAAGRLASAQLALELLLTEDSAEAARLAEELVALNQERQRQTLAATEKAIQSLGELPKVVVYFDPELPEGLAGLVAGRLKEKCCRPVIALTLDREGRAKGSARSVEGYPLHEKLREQERLLLHYGGHAMAAGLALLPENIPALRAALNEACPLSEADLTPVFRVEGMAAVEDLNLRLARELELLEPFGPGNPEPVMALMDLTWERAVIFPKKTELYLSNGAGKRIKVLDFGAFAHWLEAQKGLKDEAFCEKIKAGVKIEEPVDILVRPQINRFRGSESLQLLFTDMRFHNE